MTWLPLADHDPVPGDPYGTGDLGAYFRDEAAKLLGFVADLKGLEAGLWEGEAADAFTERRTHLIPHLEALATRWERGGQALKEWQPEMDCAKTLARRALSDAQLAEEGRIKAQADLDSARDQFFASIGSFTGEPNPAHDPMLIP